MAINSWVNLKSEDEIFFLTYEMKNKDPFSGTDIGWVSQMRPLIREFTEEGDTILDPFSGLGTTLIAAAAENRKAIGIEREEQRVHLILERWASFYFNSEDLTLLNGDCAGTLNSLLSNSKLPEISLSLSSVPYFDSDWKGSCQEGQLYGLESYQNYLNYFMQLCYLLKRAVKANGYVIMIAENIRSKSGLLLPIAWDICSIMQNFFDVYDERVIVYNKEDNQAESPQLHTNRSHEYVLVGRNSQPVQNKDEGLRFLNKFSKEFEFLLYGSFAELLNGKKSSAADIDLIMLNSKGHKLRVLGFLQKEGFILFSQDLKLIEELNDLDQIHFVRACCKKIKQLDIVFLDEEEVNKIPIRTAMFKISDGEFFIGENWTVN